MAEIKKINTDLQLEGRLLDGNGSAGTSGQVLSSTGTATDWVSLSEISGVDGSGNENYVAKWADGDSITNSTIYDNGTNVGIGTSSPNSKLTINGGINNVWSYSTATTDQPGFVAANNTSFFTQTNLLYSKIYGSDITATAFGVTLGNYAVVSTDGSDNNGLLLGTFNAKPLIIGTNAGERMRITSGGNVGIGTTSPGSKLQVYSTALRDISIFGHGTQAQNDWQAEHAFFISAGQGVMISKANASNNTNRLHLFYNTSNGDAQYMLHNTSSANTVKLNTNGDSFFNGGNVGIGTTSPGVKLTVAGSAISISNGWTGNHDILFVGGSASSTGSASQTAARIRSTASAPGGLAVGDLLFTVNSGDAFVDALYIKEDGNVGIGTTNMYARFNVRATSHNNGISVNRAADTTAAIYIGNDGGDNPILAANNADMIFGKDQSGTFTEYARIKNGGNVGIGTTSPAEKLHVSGPVIINGGTFDSSTDSTLYITAGNNNDWGLKIDAVSGKTEYGQVINMPASFNYGFLLRKNGVEHFLINDVGAKISGNYIWHAGNDGSGSGLDADLLDGNHATDFTLDYVTNNGASTTNNITVGNLTASGNITSNNGIFYSGNGTKLDLNQYNAGYLRLLTDNTERLRVTATGNVGIGTTNPGYRLDVDGGAGVALRLNSTADNQLLLTSSDSWTGIGFIDGAASGADYIWHNGQNQTFALGGGGSNVSGKKLHVHGATTIGSGLASTAAPTNGLLVEGNVGISDTNSGKKLSVKVGSSNDDGIVIKDENGNIRTDLTLAGTAGAREGRIKLIDNSGNTNVQIHSDTVSYFNGGNVGIGTTNPIEALNIGNNGQLRFDDNGSGKGIVASSNGSNQTFSITRQDGVNVGDLSISAYSGIGLTGNRNLSPATSAYALYVKSDGNVGIGTTNPVSKLHIENAGNAFSTFINSSGTSQRVDVGTNSFGEHFLFGYGAYPVLLGTNGSERMRIASNGDVGINETNPSQKLHVNGNARVTGFYYDSTNSAGTPGYVLSSTSGGTEWVTADSVISYKWYAVSDGGLASASISNSTSLDFQGGTGISTSTSGSGSAYTIEFTNTDRGSAQNIFKNVAGPTGQPTIVAASNNDTVTLKDDRFITITTNNSTKTAQFSPKALEVCDFLLAFKSPSAQTNYLSWVDGNYQSTTGLETYKTALYAGEIDVVKIISDVTVSGVYIDVYETGAPTTPIWSSGSTNLTANTLMSFSPSGATFSASDQLYATIAIPTSATVVYRLDFGLLYS
jgi:hypothetical protein